MPQPISSATRVVGALALAVSQATAQTVPTATVARNDALQVAILDPVVVTASRFEEPRSTASAVVDVISREQIEASGASNVVEFLDLVPGLTVNRLYGRLGVDANVDIGFLGEAGAMNVLVLIDGQRINSFDQAGIRFVQVPISSIDRIEVRKANGGVLFGDRAQGGVINIITREEDVRGVDVTYGSFGYQKYDAYLGFKTDSIFGSISALSANGDGYRSYSRTDQESARLSMGSATPLGTFSIAARRYREEVQLPSYLTLAQFQSNPRSVGAYPDTSERSGQAFAIKYESEKAAVNGLTVDLYQQESKDDGYYTILNKRLSLTPEYRLSYGSHRLIMGGELYSASADTNNGKQVSQISGSLYAQNSYSFAGNYIFDLGGRRQWMRNEFQKDLISATTSSTDQKNAFSLGLRIPFEWQSMLRVGALTGYRFANADELYYFGDYDRVAYLYRFQEVNTTVKPMQSSELYSEMSKRYANGSVSAHLRGIKTKDEIGFSDDCGTVSGVAVQCNTNLYDTKRIIFSLSNRHAISKDLHVSTALDLVKATTDSGGNSGKRVPLTPRHVLRMSIEQRFIGWSLLANGSYRSNMITAADSDNSQIAIPARFVADVGIRSTERHGLGWSVWIRNVLDRSYYDYAAYSWGVRGIYPADGRSVEASINYRF